MSTPSTDTPKPPRRRRWLLIGSLALNLFLIAFLVVGAVRHKWHRDDAWPFKGMLHYMQDHRYGDWYLHRLDDPDQTVMRQLKDEYGQSLSQAWRDRRAAREALRDLIRAGERDPDSLKAALTEIRSAREAGSEALDALILELAAELSDEAYRDLAGRPRHWDR